VAEFCHKKCWWYLGKEVGWKRLDGRGWMEEVRWEKETGANEEKANEETEGK